MCGLAGGTLFDADSIAVALRQLSHRGRDASKAVFYQDDGVWLGHNRLAIQDLSNSADQPLEGQFASVVFNGELWRRTMDAYPVYTSDTRLLADLYTEYGDDPAGWAGRLDGMFAVAVYDRCKRRIVLARDRIGRIPLYMAAVGGGIAFASEAKALGMALGLEFSGPTARRQKPPTIVLVPPGTVVTYDIGTGHITAVPFHSFTGYRRPAAAWDAADCGPAYYAAGIRARLEVAVANELIADVPVCTILSGGIDSTLVTAILARMVPGLRAYTVSVGGSNGKDDLAFARIAAGAIGVPLTEVIVDPGSVVGRLEEAVWAVEDDRWVQVAPAVPQIELARRIGADGYKVVFGGEGSDELFASYGDVRRWAWQPQQYADKRVALCERLHDNNLIRGNKAMMWGGTVELRTPFLDHELVDFCLRIPTRYRSNNDGKGSVMKPLLREAFRGTIPDMLLMRKKVTFQEGAHSDFLKGYNGAIKGMFRELFIR